jgi:ADP-heptose:LPS heptosyltransferase
LGNKKVILGRWILLMDININKLKRVLIIRLSSLGDILLTTPLVRSLKNKYKSIEVDFLLRKEYQEIYKYNPHLTNLFLFENPTGNNILRKLMSRNYNLVIDLQNNIRSNKLTGKLGKNVIEFRKRTIDKFLLVKFKINRMKELPQIPVRYSEIIPGLNLDEDGLELFIPDNITPRLDMFKNIIGLCPGSRHFTKKWPVDYFIELGNLLIKEGFKIVLFGGKDDRELCRQISEALADSIDLSNDNQLLHTAKEMKNCRLIICNDSGLLHLACAVKVPVIMIMGSTVKEFGFAPYKNKNLVLENNSLSCRPCSHIGRKNCPKKHFKCMLDIKPGNVFEKIKEFTVSL